MKRISIILLILLFCLSIFVSCDGTIKPIDVHKPPIDSPLVDAMSEIELEILSASTFATLQLIMFDPEYNDIVNEFKLDGENKACIGACINNSYGETISIETRQIDATTMSSLFTLNQHGKILSYYYGTIEYTIRNITSQNQVELEFKFDLAIENDLLGVYSYKGNFKVNTTTLISSGSIYINDHMPIAVNNLIK